MTKNQRLGLQLNIWAILSWILAIGFDSNISVVLILIGSLVLIPGIILFAHE